MKYLINLLTAVSISFTSLAQTGKITGSTKDESNQKIIDAATVSLVREKDSGVTKVAISDKQGVFTFENVKAGGYRVMATSLGHSKVYSKSFLVSAASDAIDLDVLQLKPVDKNLKEVTVV